MEMEMNGQAALPVVGITMGDPAGVGPEVVVKALLDGEMHKLCRPIVIGDAAVLRKMAEILGLPLPVRSVSQIAEARFSSGTADVLDLGNVNLSDLEIGKVSAMAGKASVECIFRAIDLARQGEIGAIVTAPINKKAIQVAGYHYLGHTEIFVELTNSARSTTMLVSGPLRVTHVTRHVPLSQVASSITRDRVLETICITAEGLAGFGLAHARLGVAALNPHGGDGGLLGREEIEAIAPAVDAARLQGLDARGPYPADSIFFRAIAGEFDAVVAMYHDQGHIPIKVYDFEGSFTVTLGLPILRTSVDHGTAFDIAWKCVASSRSLMEAIRWAARWAGKSTGPG